MGMGPDNQVCARLRDPGRLVLLRPVQFIRPFRSPVDEHNDVVADLLGIPDDLQQLRRIQAAENTGGIGRGPFCIRVVKPLNLGSRYERNLFVIDNKGNRPGRFFQVASRPHIRDGKALQAGTSHYFGDGFAKAFGIQFSGKDNTLETPHQTSWGVSTRLIGAIIMAHGDDNGLVLPPAVAPIQVVILPIAQHKPGVLEKAAELKERLSAVARVKVDDSENSAGWKFAEYEMKGVPLRLEIGPKDIENNQCVLVTRHDREKHVVPLDELETAIPALLQKVHDGLYRKALENRQRRTYSCTSMDEITRVLEERGDGFIEAMWCGDEACEDKVKETTGVGSRCIPFEQKHLSDTCVCCGKPAKHMVLWAKAY